MLRRVSVLALACTLLVGIAGCSLFEKSESVSTESCVCDDGKAGKDVWCEKCDAGYVNSEKVACEGCYAVKTGASEKCEDCAK